MSTSAELTTEISPFTGKERLRCSGCGKVAFYSKSRADEAAEKIYTLRREEMRSYFGECGWWHLSRVNR